MSNADCRFADSTPAFANSPWTCNRILTISRGFVKIYMSDEVGESGHVQLDMHPHCHQPKVPKDMLKTHPPSWELFHELDH